MQPPAAFPVGPTAWEAPLPPSPRPKRHRKWPWLLGGAVLGLVVLAGVAAVLWIQLVKPPLDAANDYVSAVVDGDFAEAYEQLCPEQQASTGSAESLTQLRSYLLGNNFDEFWISPFDVNRDGDEANIDVNQNSDFDGSYVTLELVHEDGEWRPCGTFYGLRSE